MDQEKEMLLRENTTLKNWVIGLLSECEGCRTDAEAWAAALASGETDSHENDSQLEEVVS